MSKLDELIQEYCPDGVEYKKTIEICSRICSGGTPNSKKEDYYGGEIPWLRTQEVDFGPIYSTEMNISADGLKNSSAKWIKKNCVIIAMYGATVGKVAYNAIPLTTNQACCNLEINPEIAYFKFVFHFFCSKSKYLKSLGQGSQTNINAQIIKEIEIPVPPLPVQEEIVGVLDRFSQLTTDLIEALQTELQLRKKQYEYYRTTLLECTDINSTILPIPEFANTFIGLVTTMTKHYVREGVPLIHNSSIKENRFEFKEHIYLDYEFAEKNKSKRHKKGDVITVHTGDVGTSAIIQDDLDGSLGFATIVSRIEDTDFVLPEWLCHCLNSKLCKNQISGMIKGDRNNLNLKDFNKLVIPIPSIAEQKRIIEILDRFDALCNDLSSGIPAEIEARKKQYEYYRDKLLSFKPLSSKN